MAPPCLLLPSWRPDVLANLRTNIFFLGRSSHARRSKGHTTQSGFRRPSTRCPDFLRFRSVLHSVSERSGTAGRSFIGSAGTDGGPLPAKADSCRALVPVSDRKDSVSCK